MITIPRKVYSIRKAIPKKKTLEVTFPYEIVQREAENRGMTVAEFIKHWQVITEDKGWRGVLYKFTPKILAGS